MTPSILLFKRLIRGEIWCWLSKLRWNVYNLSNCNRIHSHNQLPKTKTQPFTQTVAKCLSVLLQTNWLRFLILLQSLSILLIQCMSTSFNRQIIRMKSRRFLRSAAVYSPKLPEDTSYTEHYFFLLFSRIHLQRLRV